MKKILTIEEAIRISIRLRKQNKTIVLGGGCFDILHLGHIEFLKKAKKSGDFLFLLLENDESIKRQKGNDRPINSQKDRAKVLASLSDVDYIIPLTLMNSNKDYDNLILRLKPAIIATTKNDSARFHKERQAKLVGGKVIDVVNRISGKSTSDLAKIILKDYYL